jgi:hypothetical protein
VWCHQNGVTYGLLLASGKGAAVLALSYAIKVCRPPDKSFVYVCVVLENSVQCLFSTS